MNNGSGLSPLYARSRHGYRSLRNVSFLHGLAGCITLIVSRQVVQYFSVFEITSPLGNFTVLILFGSEVVAAVKAIQMNPDVNLLTWGQQIIVLVI